jgi:HAD superfamily hydrolase (TIGR01509 family)
MTFPRPIEAVVFDMDGLLVDTEVVVRAACVRAAERCGRVLPHAVYAQTIGRSDVATEALWRAHFGADFPFDLYRATEAEEIAAAFAGGVALKRGALDLLDALDALALPFALATSSSIVSARRHLSEHGVLNRFRAVVAREDVSDHKPHPAPYREAARRLGVPPERCLALEDSHNGVRAAHAAGMMTVMVPDLLEATDEMRGLCVHVADDLHKVLDLITAQDT